MNDTLLEMSRWLWDYYLHATILLVITLLAAMLVRQPARRMALHWSMSAALLALALLCAVPGWSIVHLLSAPPQPAPVWEPVAEPMLGQAIQQVPSEVIPQVVDLPPAPVNVETVAPQQEVVPAESLLAIDYGILSLYLVLVGSIVSLLWLTLGQWQVRRLRQCAEAAPAELQQLLATLMPAEKAQPGLGVVERLQVAVALGLRRPLILLPKRFQREPNSEKLRTVLAHELAHVHHRDLWLLALLRALMLLLWAHPVYWLWRRGVRLDQETLADAAAAELSSRDRYAEQLVEWARTAAATGTPRIAASVGLWESPSQLKRRLTVLLDEKLTLLRRCSRRWRVGATLLIAALAILLSLVTLRPDTESVAEELQELDVLETVEERNEDIDPTSFVRIVVDTSDKLTFEGEPTTWEKLPKLLEAVPNRQGTVLEIAIASDDLSVRQLNQSQSQAAVLANKYGFKYSSYIGVHPLGSKGTGSGDDDRTDSEPRLSTYPEFDKVFSKSGAFQELQLQKWIPDDLKPRCRYYSFEPKTLLDKLRPVFDEFAGYDNAFANVLEGLEKDPYGPRINLDDDLVAHLTGQVTIITDKNGEVTDDSTEWLIALPVNHSDKMSETVAAFLSKEPNMQQVKLHGCAAWLEKESSPSIFYCVALDKFLFGRDVKLLERVLLHNTSGEADAMLTPNQTPGAEQTALLKELIDIKQQEVDRIQELREQAVVSASEVRKAQSELITAQMAMAKTQGKTVQVVKYCQDLLKLAEADFERVEALWKDHVVPKTEVSKARESVIRAKLELSRALQESKKKEQANVSPDLGTSDAGAEASGLTLIPNRPTYSQRTSLIEPSKDSEVDSLLVSDVYVPTGLFDSSGNPVSTQGVVVVGEVASLDSEAEQPPGEVVSIRDINEVSEAQATLAATTPAVGDGSRDRDEPAESDAAVASETTESPKETVSAGEKPSSDQKERAQAMRALMKKLDEQTKPNTLHGLCLDENGKPLVGVNVQLFLYHRDGRPNGDKPQQTTMSDKNGFYSFQDVLDVKKEFPKGVPNLLEPLRGETMVTLVGRSTGRVPGFSSARASEIARDGIRNIWTMLPAGAIRGRVTDEQGHPVVGAEVKAGLAAMLLLGGARGINSTVTDDNGEYEIDDLPLYDLEEEKRKLAELEKNDPQAMALHLTGGAPTQWLYVTHPEFAARRTPLDHIPGSVDVTLSPGCVIEGHVELPQGEKWDNSLQGSVVRLQRASSELNEMILDEHGDYRFQSLPAGKYHISAEAKGWLTRGIENVEAKVGEVTTAPPIKLSRGGRVRVQLVDDATGKPMQFEKPKFGYLNFFRHPSGSVGFPSLSNIVEFSTEGVGERQALPGKYTVLPNIPLPDGGSLEQALSADVDEWPQYEVKEGEELDVSIRVRAKEPPRAVTGSLQLSLPAAEGDEEEDDSEGKNFFVPATPPAESSTE